MKKAIKKERNIKGYIYARLPFSGKFKKQLKNFYYDFIAWPIQKFKNKVNYNMWDFFGAVDIDTITYCQLRCKFCPNSKYERGLLKNKKIMDINLFKKIINELAEINYKGIIRPFFYGDPLTDERMPDLIKYVKKKLPKSKVYLNTNGVALTIKLYKQLYDAGIDYLMISQYTNEMLPNIKILFNYLKTRPKKENKTKYRIFNEKTIAISNRCGEIEIKNKVDRPFCAYPGHYDLNIDYEGNVILCCNDYHSSVKFGNIKNEKIIDIWKKPHFYKLRKEVRTGTYKLPICRKCVGIE